MSACARDTWRLAGAAILFVVLHTCYVLQIQPDVAYMDTLRYIGYYADVEAHPWRAFAYWHQGGHRGLLTQAVLWANMGALGMNLLLANVLTGFVLAGIASSIAWRWLRAGAPQGGWRAWAITLFVFLAVFSPAGFELHTLDIGFAEIGRNLYYLAVVIPVLDPQRRPGRALAGALAVLIVGGMLFVSYGRIYAFGAALAATAVLAARARARAGDGDGATPRWGWAVAGTVAVGFAIFFVMSSVIPSSVGMAPGLAPSPWLVIRGASLAAASALISAEAAMHGGVTPSLLGLAGALLVAGTALASARYLRLLRAGAPALPLFLALYGGLNALAIGAARAGPDFAAAMASRYYPDLCLALLGLAWMLLALHDASRQGAHRRAWGAAVAVLALAWAAGFAYTTAVERATAPYRTKAFNEMRDATLSCAPLDEADAALLQANSLAIAQRAVDYQREHRLGPWRTTTKTCD